MTQASLLLVDDDRELDQMLTEYLVEEGFAVTTALDGSAALRWLANARFDLAILDVMLPAVNGLEVLRSLRRTLSLPVIMLTARGSDIDRIEGLDLGADDYLAKPFNPRELVARIRAVLRRASAAARPGTMIALGPLTIEPATFDARIGDRPLRLTGTEFRVLELLGEAAGQVLPRAFLTERVLGRKLSAYDRSIDTHISNLRRKLVQEPHCGIEIRSVRGLGYVLVGGGEVGS